MSTAVDSLWMRAQQLLAHDKTVEAQRALASLLELQPGHANAHLLLSALAHTQGRLRDSAQHALDASQEPFDDTATLCNAVMALLRTGEVAQAHRCLQDPLIAACTAGPLLLRLASAQQAMENHPEALRLLDRAIASGMDSADIRYLRAVQLTFNGHASQAEAELENCLRLGTSFGRASLTLARARKQTREHNHVGFIRERLLQVAPGSEDHAAFEFALYKELEDLGEYEPAWVALARGNAIMAARLRPDSTRERALLDGLIARTSGWPAATTVDTAADTGPQPIFIIGMPRSGTTLLDRILGNHSRVTSVGELGDAARQLRWAADHVTGMPIDEVILSRLDRIDWAEVGRRYLQQTRWRATGSRYFVDKLPVNYLLAGLIARALPEARILHLVRDPMAVCFSNYRAYFGGGYAYSYALDALAEQYLGYRRLMQHWHALLPGRILDVGYGRLTDDPEATIREVFAFCDLAHEPGCLDLERNQAPVATLSTMQVRGGIRRTTSEDWRRYEVQLAPLQARLASAS